MNWIFIDCKPKIKKGNQKGIKSFFDFEVVHLSDDNDYYNVHKLIIDINYLNYLEDSKNIFNRFKYNLCYLYLNHKLKTISNQLVMPTNFVLPIDIDFENQTMHKILELFARYGLKYFRYTGNAKQNVLKYMSKEKIDNTKRILIISDDVSFDKNVLEVLLNKYKTVDIYLTCKSKNNSKFQSIKKSVTAINTEQGSMVEVFENMGRKRINEYSVLIWLINTELKQLRTNEKINVYLYNNDNDIFDVYIQKLKQSKKYKEMNIDKVREISNVYGRVNTAYVLCDKFKI